MIEPGYIRVISELESAWHGKLQVSEPQKYFGWEPYDANSFVAFLELCLPFVPVDKPAFIDAGCGIGTKCLLAEQLGLEVYGIDRVPEFLSEAAKLGIKTEQVLVQEFTGFDRFGLVYVNHPMVCGEGCEDEAELEHHIQESMASGAVLMAVNYDLAPGCSQHPFSEPCNDHCLPESAGWTQIARIGSWDAAWVKP